MYRPHNQFQSLHDDCRKYVLYHCNFTMTDGSTFDGIVESVSPDQVTVLIGEDVMEENYRDDERLYGYGVPRRRYRRFRRQAFPIASLAALALLPYVIGQPYPYEPYYPYPYYPYY